MALPILKEQQWQSGCKHVMPTFKYAGSMLHCEDRGKLYICNAGIGLGPLILAVQNPNKAITQCEQFPFSLVHSHHLRLLRK